MAKTSFMRKTGLFLLFLLSFSLHNFAQNKDSILKILPAVQDEKARIRLIYDIIGDSGDSDPEKALHYYKKLLELARQMKDKVAEAVLTSEMGYAIYYMGNTVSGSEMMLKGLRMAEDENDNQAIGIAYDNLGFIYPDPLKRRELMRKGYAASSACNDYLFMCWELANIGATFNPATEPDSAMYYAQQELELAMSHKVEECISGALVKVGGLYYLQGQKELALQHEYAALRQPYLKKDAKTASRAYDALCNYYLQENKPDSALHYALSGVEATKNAFFAIRISPMFYLSRAYEENNQSDSALQYLKVYYSMKDSMNNTLKQQQIQSQVLSEDERQDNLREERKHNLEYSALALGVVLLLIMFFIFSHSIIANQKLIRFLGILSLLIVFELLNLFLHPFLERVTHHQPVLMLACMVCIAALLIPLHHKLEHWITHKLVEKNNRIRLAAARRTIEELERNKEG